MDKKKPPKKWHPQQEKILKAWGESSSCYRYLHFKSYLKFKNISMSFTLPIIVISTITGTANFAQDTFPESWSEYVPLGIGGLNLIAAIATTVLQFIKANELSEAHRVASIAYGKLSRDIKLELSLPVLDRNHDGNKLIARCSSDYDRLIEQSPPVPEDVLSNFEKNYKKNDELEKPEIIDIKPIKLFDQLKENTIIKNVKNMFRKPSNVSIPAVEPAASFISTNNDHKIDIFKEGHKRIADELKELTKKNLVTMRGAPSDSESDIEFGDANSIEEGSEA